MAVAKETITTRGPCERIAEQTGLSQVVTARAVRAFLDEIVACPYGAAVRRCDETGMSRESETARRRSSQLHANVPWQSHGFLRRGGRWPGTERSGH
jgi:hypothetical protein